MLPELTPLEKDLYTVLCKHLGSPLSIVKIHQDYDSTLERAFRSAVAAFFMIHARGNQSQAAKRANINRNTLRRYVRNIQGNPLYFARDYNYLHYRFNGQTSPS